MKPHRLPFVLLLLALASLSLGAPGDPPAPPPLPHHGPALALQHTDARGIFADPILVQNATSTPGTAGSPTPPPEPAPPPAAPEPPLSTPSPAPLPAPLPAPAPAPAPYTGPQGYNPAAGAGQLPQLPSDGYWVDGAPINDVFQYLSRKAGYQYFFNNEIIGPQYVVTGHLQLDDPDRQMEDLAVAFGLSVYRQGKTLYVMNETQLARLPLEIMSYQLKYLRGSSPSRVSTQSSEEAGGGGGGGADGGGLQDFEKLKSIIRPMLTKSVGQIEFEEKTNTLLVTDNSVKIKRIKDLLEKIDRPKQQIAVNVRVLRVINRKGKKVGVDWSTTLGDGLTVAASQSLNAMFNLPDTSVLTKAASTARDLTSSFDNSTNFNNVISREGRNPVTTIDNNILSSGSTTSSTSSQHDSVYQDGPGLIFEPLQVQAIIRALEENGIVTQESCPTIITEDNEQGIISIVDRFPIITSTVSETTAGQNVSEEVRYKIDQQDPDAMQEPEKSREIGVTLSVTPTLLPDGTVRMKLRPRVAKIVELITGQTGNIYPRVSESTAEAISRIPSGQSLILGGFYDYNSSKDKNGVPILDKIPLVKKLFSSKDQSLEKVSLVFIITPKVYDANSPHGIRAINQDVRTDANFPAARLDAMSERYLPPYPSGAPVPAAYEVQGQTVSPTTSLKTSVTQPSPPPAAEPPKKKSLLRRLFTREPKTPSPR